MGGGGENNREQRVCEARGSGHPEETRSCRLKGTGRFPGWPDCTVTTQAHFRAAVYAPLKTFLLEQFITIRHETGAAPQRGAELHPRQKHRARSVQTDPQGPVLRAVHRSEEVTSVTGHTPFRRVLRKVLTSPEMDPQVRVSRPRGDHGSRGGRGGNGGVWHSRPAEGGLPGSVSTGPVSTGPVSTGSVSTGSVSTRPAHKTTSGSSLVA